MEKCFGEVHDPEERPGVTVQVISQRRWRKAAARWSLAVFSMRLE